MKRKGNVFRKIGWARQDQQSVSKDLYCGATLNIENCIKLTCQCLEHLNSVYDYIIKDFVESSKSEIKNRYYFPFSEIKGNKPLRKLPKDYFIFINDLAKKFKTQEVIPRTKIQYNLLSKMRELVNEGKHNNISLEMKEIDTGDIQYYSNFGIVIVHGAENLEKRGCVINPHMERKGKVPNLYFNEEEILSGDEREVTHFCIYAISGTKRIAQTIYDFIDYKQNIKRLD